MSFRLSHRMVMLHITACVPGVDFCKLSYHLALSQNILMNSQPNQNSVFSMFYFMQYFGGVQPFQA